MHTSLLWRLPITLLGVLLFSPAKSALVVSLEPSLPSAGEEIFAHITSTSGPLCFPPRGIITTEDGVINFKFIVPDACVSSDFISERQYSIGSLESGSYRVDLSICCDNPPPHPSPCTIVAEVPFVVGSDPAAVSASIDSPYLFAAMISVLGWFGLWTVRSRLRV